MQAAHYRCRPHERLALTAGKSEHMQQKWLALFRSNIEPDWETGCWVWTGATNEHGYGMYQAGGSWLAHRYSYVWFRGGHERGKVLDHLCNRIECVRPDHLWPVTNTLNAAFRDQRAMDPDQEYFRDVWFNNSSLPMMRWAVHNDLPASRPSRRVLAAKSSPTQTGMVPFALGDLARE